MNELPKENNQSLPPNEALKPLIDAFVESARRSLEYDITKYSLKRYESFICKGYYKKKLYKAILALREFNKEVAEK
ncbi:MULTISPECIES: hypothetical protein [unclassified Dysgonomonas]|uniref:hypothetical protein n=1 Tax=unclassified Dysgonomonas TaxID=2630389 RepID=UPI000682DC52|nr:MULTISPECIES: hypothetical protein [unclassified Dysgonomonas]MBD8349396.1 hypothetical protein [Dysgonomonas sp. HGC4]MBF0578002.1 hypothetical protein [Dysgonomonas sp. GY617]